MMPELQLHRRHVYHPHSTIWCVLPIIHIKRPPTDIPVLSCAEDSEALKKLLTVTLRGLGDIPRLQSQLDLLVLL